jgi:hypothetical protein
MERCKFRVDDDPDAFPGAVLCRDISIVTPRGYWTARRGTSLNEVLRRLAGDQGNIQLDLVVPASDEITQEDASLDIARHITGPGIVIGEPHQGQVDLYSIEAGLLRVRGEAVTRLNRCQVALVVTALDGRVVDAGESIAVVKAARLFVTQDELDCVLTQAGQQRLLWISPFRMHRVGLIAGARIRPANLQRAARHLAATLGRFGADLAVVQRVDDDPDEIAAMYRSFLADGIQVILVAGSIVLDPADPCLMALQHIDAQVVCRGVPIDPGTMFWVAYTGLVPIFGLASCEMYGRLSVLDLLLPFALAGEPISASLIAELGYGGLLKDTYQARRPSSWKDKR